MTRPSHLMFRCDASPNMGSGHVMRCLTLANVLKQDFGGIATFYCTELVGSLADRIKYAGHNLIWLDEDLAQTDSGQSLVNIANEQGAIGIVIDGYHLDKKYRVPIAVSSQTIITFQDAGSESFGADIIINTAPCATATSNLPVHNQPLILAGPRYALIAPAILEARNSNLTAKGILITFGGSDPRQLTLPVAQYMRSSLPDVPIHAVLGGSVKNEDTIRTRLLDIPNLRVSTDLPNLGAAIAEAQLVISAAGSTLYEVAALGRAMVLAITEDNQSDLGSIDWASAVDVRRNVNASQIIADTASRIFADAKQMETMAKDAQRIVDGEGAHRILDAVLAHCSGNLKIF